MNYVAYVGQAQIARGPLEPLLRVLKARFDQCLSELTLVFEVESGRQVDFDLSGEWSEVWERALAAAPEEQALPTTSRGPGRPRLGVVSREVTLLPRHWRWLETQPGGVSGALRRLVEAAIRDGGAAEEVRQARAALGSFLTAMAGNLVNYEAACRALYAGDAPGFEAAARGWPKDIAEFARERFHAIAAEEASSTGGASAPL